MKKLFMAALAALVLAGACSPTNVYILPGGEEPTPGQGGNPGGGNSGGGGNNPGQGGGNTVVPDTLALLTKSIEMGYMEAAMLEFVITPWDNSFQVSDISVSVDDPARCSSMSLLKGNQGHFSVCISDNGSGAEYSTTARVSLKVQDKTFSSGDVPVHAKARLTGELPAVYIDTKGAPIVDTPDWLDMTIRIDGKGKFPDLDAISAGIRLRGNTTRYFEKKPYAIKLSKKKSVLGMPEHKRWCLIANYVDRSFLRNKLSYYIGSRTDLEYTPRCEFVNVYLNGAFQGNYLLTDQIKVDKNRLNLPEEGSFLLELDTYPDTDPFFYTEPDRFRVNIKFPEDEACTEERQRYIETYMNRANSKIRWETSASGEYFDWDSFIDYWIVNEIAGNKECTVPKSFYVHVPPEGKIYAGPIWDFDYNTYMGDDEYVHNWCLSRYGHWFILLMGDPTFNEMARTRWKEIYPFLTTLPAYVRAQAEYISASVAADCTLWNLEIKQENNGDAGKTPAQAAVSLEQNLSERIEWLNTKINEGRIGK